MEPTSTLLRIEPGQDPALLRAFLAAHFAGERASGLRELGVHLVALLSVFVWILAVWPGRLGAALGATLLALWGVGALSTVAALLAEAGWRRRAARLRRQLDAPPHPRA